MSNQSTTSQSNASPGTAVPKQYFVSDEAQVIDVALPDGLYTPEGRSKSELERDYGNLTVMDAKQAITAAESRYIQDTPKEMSEEDFMDMLEIMPPMKWHRAAGSESFRLMEPYTYSVHEAFVRYGNRFFRFLRPLADGHDTLVDLVEKHIASSPVAASA